LILYKYTEKKYLLSFKEKGEVLVNTLSNLRAKYEPIGDAKEGRQQTLIGSKKGMVLDVEELHKVAPVIKVPEGYKENKGNIKLVFGENAIINSDEYVPDAFVFSASIGSNSEIPRRFPNYDAYYKILNPEHFADILYEKLSEKFIIFGFQIGEVKYASKRIVLDTYEKVVAFRQDPSKFWNLCCTKSPEYSYQTEFRMVFIPTMKTQLESQIIQSLDLVKCCSLE
jgi:hypothetical protein